MRVILHIGMSKTGSTALQRSLDANRAVLADRGVIYSRTFNLSSIAAAFGTRVVAGAECVDEIEDYEGDPMRPAIHDAKWSASLDSAFDDEIAAAGGAETMIVSHETLWYVFCTVPRAMEWARAYLLRRFDAVAVVVYLRRQDAHIASEYAQRFKGGRPRLWDEHVAVSLQDPRYDYRARVADLDRVFGRDAVHVRPYERSALREGDATSDFLTLIGIEPQGSFDGAREANAAWDRDTLSFLLALRKQTPFVEDRAFTPVFIRLRRALDASPQNGELIALSRATSKRLLAPYREGNERLARERLGRADGTLFHEPLPTRGDDVLPQADADALARRALDLARFDDAECSRYAQGRERMRARIASLERTVESLREQGPGAVPSPSGRG